MLLVCLSDRQSLLAWKQEVARITCTHCYCVTLGAEAFDGLEEENFRVSHDTYNLNCDIKRRKNV
jgi:hypothetical protein